jgi:hypothetical protein
VSVWPSRFFNEVAEFEETAGHEPIKRAIARGPGIPAAGKSDAPPLLPSSLDPLCDIRYWLVGLWSIKWREGYMDYDVFCKISEI